MRPSLAHAALGALVFAMVASLPGAATADNFYRYTKNGKVWYSNTCPVKNCTLVLRGASGGSRSSGGAPPRASAGGATGSVSIPVPALTEPPSDFAAAIARASSRYQIPEALIRAVIRVESNYNPNAVSRAGAMGLMQLMPGTAREQGVTDRLDPEQNIMGGTRYLRWLANKFQGDIIKTLAGYHAGHNAVESKGGIPYTATEQYVKKVLGHYYRYKASTTTAHAVQ